MLFRSRLREMRPDALMPEEVLKIATQGGSQCLGMYNSGSLEIGQNADIAVWPGSDLEDIRNPIDGLILGPDRRAKHVLVKGNLIVKDGQVLGTDLAKAHQDLAKHARRIWKHD